MPPTPPTQTPTPLRQGVFTAPFGDLGVAWRGERLVGIALDGLAADAPAGESLPPWLQAALAGYFADPRRAPACPHESPGTPFQRRVWDLIAAIPCGETRPYSALAAALGTGARAVGGACRANPLPLVVPCHRVVAAQGLGGFSGDRSGRLLAIKRWLLTHEGAALTLEGCR